MIDRTMAPDPQEQAELEAAREKLYTEYASTHGSHADVPATGVFVRKVLLPLFPPAPARVVEVACGAGHTVRELQEAGYQAAGVDTSREQVALARRAGIPGVELGDACAFLRQLDYSPDVVLAIDFLEHLTKSELLDLLALVRHRLAPAGRLVARLPNGSSPFFGRMQHGDLSHETAFAPRSIRQALNLAGFGQVKVLPANPVVHGIPSFVRAGVWAGSAALLKVMLIAETGFWRGHVVTQNMLVVAQR